MISSSNTRLVCFSLHPLPLLSFTSFFTIFFNSNNVPGFLQPCGVEHIYCYWWFACTSRCHQAIYILMRISKAQSFLQVCSTVQLSPDKSRSYRDCANAWKSLLRFSLKQKKKKRAIRLSRDSPIRRQKEILTRSPTCRSHILISFKATMGVYR